MKKLLIGIIVLMAHFTIRAQGPVSWTFTAKKTAANTYQLHMVAVVSDPWHIYSQFTPAGGPVATKVKFAKNPLVMLQGKVTEIGTLETKHEEVFDVDVKYFSHSVDFVQLIHLKSKFPTVLAGTLEFMACNDQQCLPPRKVPFSVKLR